MSIKVKWKCLNAYIHIYFSINVWLQLQILLWLWLVLILSHRDIYKDELQLAMHTCMYLNLFANTYISIRNLKGVETRNV